MSEVMSDLNVSCPKGYCGGGEKWRHLRQVLERPMAYITAHRNKFPAHMQYMQQQKDNCEENRKTPHATMPPACRSELAALCKKGETNSVKRYLTRTDADVGALLAAPDDSGWTCLHHAASEGHVPVVGELLAKASAVWKRESR